MASKQSKSSAVSIVKDGGKAVGAPIDFVPDVEQFKSGMDAGAVAMPFLKLLQGLSPEVQRGTPQYIAGAQPGLILNTVTKEVYDKVQVTILLRTHTYTFWTPRDDGGGFKGEEAATPELDARFRELFEAAQKRAKDSKEKKINVRTPDGLEMMSNRNFFCMLHRDGEAPIPVVISMAKTQLKEAGNWNFNISAKSVPNVLTSEIWELTGVMTKKGENQWYVWSAKHLQRHTDARLHGQAVEAVPAVKAIKVLARQADEEVTADSSAEM